MSQCFEKQEWVCFSSAETRWCGLHPEKDLCGKDTRNTEPAGTSGGPPKSYFRTMELSLCSMLRSYNPMPKWAVRDRASQVLFQNNGTFSVFNVKILQPNAKMSSKRQGEIGALAEGYFNTVMSDMFLCAYISCGLNITFSFHTGFPKHILCIFRAGRKPSSNWGY